MRSTIACQEAVKLTYLLQIWHFSIRKCSFPNLEKCQTESTANRALPRRSIQWFDLYSKHPFERRREESSSKTTHVQNFLVKPKNCRSGLHENLWTVTRGQLSSCSFVLQMLWSTQTSLMTCSPIPWDLQWHTRMRALFTMQTAKLSLDHIIVGMQHTTEVQYCEQWNNCPSMQWKK